MRTFKQRFNYHLAFFLFITIFSGFTPVFAESPEAGGEASHHAHNSDWPGVYHGFVPCDDCRGIKTSLALNKQNTYILITQLVDKSTKEMVEKGKFTWDESSNTITLTPRNSSVIRQYSPGKDMLIQLDGNGKRVTGKLADRYILRRIDITANPPSHPSH